MSRKNTTLRVVQHAGLSCRESTTPVSQARATLLWIHGLGESGLGFERLLLAPELNEFHQLAPDLSGYGRTAWPADDAPLTLIQHADSVANLLDYRVHPEGDTPVLAEDLIVIGHSMGGVIGQILCQKESERIRAFINIEGNLSLGDCGYSGQAAAQNLADFLDHGFDDLRDEIYRIGQQDAAHRSYGVSCRLAHPQTYYQNSVELVALSRQETLARQFADLPQAKEFVHGSPGGAPQGSSDLLRSNQVKPKVFDPAGHWPFIDQHEMFVVWLTATLDRYTK